MKVGRVTTIWIKQNMKETIITKEEEKEKEGVHSHYDTPWMSSKL
jgi:hypothetical protein